MRVASVRSRFTEVQEARVTEILADSFGALVRGEIDNETFIARKEAAVARVRQEKGDAKLDELLTAFNQAKRVERVLEQAKRGVRVAWAKVEELLQPFEADASSGIGAGSSALVAAQ
mmetsp:Transcript_26228/g.69551  ORF Transcript_26228/g.69551 Transcript_26228/m.69551 type:complete len:117 (+) Transcript_26228:87-437(+)